MEKQKNTHHKAGEKTEQAKPGDKMSHSMFSLVAVASVFCCSGSALTLLNKHVMQRLPAPNVILLLQNSGTLLLLLFGKDVVPYTIEPLKRENVLKWLQLVLLFYVMLVSSMFALEYVTATTLIVQRNLSTVTIAFADYFVIGTKQNFRRIAAIISMCLGAFLYAHDDVRGANFNLLGYVWLTLNIISTTAYQVKVKSLVNELNMNSWSMSYYNNALSLPFCLLFAFGNSEPSVLEQHIKTFNSFDIFATIISCTLGFSLSVSAFRLNRMITPTSITVLNNANKFALICFTANFLDASTLSTNSVAGIVIVMMAAAAYSLAGLQ